LDIKVFGTTLKEMFDLDPLDEDHIVIKWDWEEMKEEFPEKDQPIYREFEFAGTEW
jgi:hypothetical protein